MTIAEQIPPSRPSGRIEGVDVARGLAGLIMIGGHATHGWVSPAEKETLGYAVTRLFGTLPLPAFLVLAGAAVAWRVDAAEHRKEDAAAVRRRVAWRGLQIVAWGYGVSALYALMDGGATLNTLLRADVLHVIGLSIAGMAWLGIRPTARTGTSPDSRRFAMTALLLGGSVTLICPWATQIGLQTEGPARYLVGLFVDAPGVTRMPFVPLAAWLCVGIGAARWMLAARRRTAASSPAGAPAATLVRIGLLGLCMAAAGWWLTPLAVAAYGAESLTRAHPAVWLNVLDLAGRGLFVLAAGAMLANHVRGPARTVLLRLGRSSLVAYVFHIPFCYGVLGRPFIDRLTVLEALGLTVALVALSYAAVLATTRWQQQLLRPARRLLAGQPRNSA